MSGIAAILERNGAPAGEKRIAAMLGRLRQRGPDRSAYHVEDSAALAQAMFGTTPEDALDRQPLASRAGKRWIVADARVDNRRELLSLCSEAAQPANEVSDAALILLSYERWGEACPSRIVGDFAFVIWDGDRRCLFCARDHLGVRQLYYQEDAATFRCGTEMHALFADERVPRRPNRRSMALFLVYEYAERDETLYEGVHALPPGHTLTVTSTSIRREAYWQPDPWHTREGDHSQRLAEVFGEAVRCRLRASGPLAAQVSGGLDSSSVACEAERLRKTGLSEGTPLLLLRAVFPGLDCDERRYSQAVADHLGLPIATCSPIARPDICRLEAPYPDLYFHPTRTMLDPLLGDLRRRGTRVVLTGGGGDMLMQPTGYEVAHDLREGRLGSAIEGAALGSRLFSQAAWRKLMGQSLWAFAPRAAAWLKRRAQPARTSWPWLSSEAADIVDAHLAREGAEARSLHPDPQRAELCRGVTYGVGSLLPLAIDDRTGALNGLEFRHPFLDVRVVELLLRSPSEERFTFEQSKRVLRRAMGPTLPALVRERPDKAEFSSYVRRVFLEDQRAALQRLLAKSRLEDLGLVRARPLRRLIDAPPPAQNALGLVNLTAMELWLRSTVRRTFANDPPALRENRHEHA
jgi:asparagine synthase (glutamine-hydrolysing)